MANSPQIQALTANAHPAIAIAIDSFNEASRDKLGIHGALDAGQAAVLADPSPEAEEDACGMLDDMQARIGYSVDHIAVLRKALQRRFIDERILQGMNEIGAAVINRTPILGSKVPPANLRTFAQLHDYCDANCIGGLCDDDMQARIDILFPKTNGEDTLGSEEWMDAANDIQSALHEFIVYENFGGREWGSEVWAPITSIVGQYRIEFPTFGELDVTIPVGFIDESWHNNACPSFRRGNYCLYVDYSDIDLSDYRTDARRFLLVVCNDDNSATEELLLTDEWTKVEAYFADELGNGRAHSDEHPLYLQLRDTA